MKISDEIHDWCDFYSGESINNDDCDKLRALADRIDSEMVELPRDRDGVRIHVGDTVWGCSSGMKVTIGELRMANADSYCECPYCRRQFHVTWGFETLGITRVGEEDGAVLTDSDDMYATRVVYLRSVRCPHCGTRLRIDHGLVPEFYAFKEDCDERQA